MKVSVIVTLYKDLISLGFVLDALRRQTYKCFEVIVAEDDDCHETIMFLKKQKGLEIKHISQPDTGRNKVRIQNKAIAISSGEYLIFIDGDIIPFRHFIEYSMRLSRHERVLVGRRVNLDEKITKLVKGGELNIVDLEDGRLKFFLKNFNNRSVRAEQIIEVNPNGIVYKFLSKRKRSTEVLGCNFSCFKETMLVINGFDEDYHPLATLADDTDLTWRLKGMGFELFSSKNVANCFHLWHQSGGEYDSFDPCTGIQLFKLNQKNKKFRCKNGVDKYL